MTDFTKEELEEIHYGIWTWEGTRDKPKIIQDIQNKIQSMIDNYSEPKYCEHSGVKIDD